MQKTSVCPFQLPTSSEESAVSNTLLYYHWPKYIHRKLSQPVSQEAEVKYVICLQGTNINVTGNLLDWVPT